MKQNQEHTRRRFIQSVSMLAATSILPVSAFSFSKKNKLKIALIGTGIRGITFWGKRLQEEYSEILEFVGLSDHNKGRLEYGKNYIGTNCPTFDKFEDMVSATQPDLVIVTTRDSNHHEFIIKGLEMGCDVLTEKPLTTDEIKCQAIIDAERKSDRKLIVGFNYRWSPYNTKVKELLMNETIGKITSVDFHWYLNTYHGASYFRRWHGRMDGGGSLWVHKATHHFDLLNWWLDTEPKEVFAYGDLEYYGKKGPFRGNNCRDCNHTEECSFHMNILENDGYRELYVDHEHHDGYIRDNCLYREEIDIYDKMSAQIKYMNDTVVNYSLTTYSPFEGWRASFNGTKGRIEAWLDIPYHNSNEQISQDEMHKREMEQSDEVDMAREPIIVHKLWEDFKEEIVSFEREGHGGGDKLLQDKLFITQNEIDPFYRSAGIRDGAMSILTGIAARRSIEQGKPIRIDSLTDLKPSADKQITK